MADFIITDPSPVPSVRTNQTKYKALNSTIKKLLTGVTATPEQVDIFALSVAIRGALPSGLNADDFDGNDVAEIVQTLLGV
jgi:hypothetical protein